MPKKKQTSLSDKIADLIAPRRLLDPEIDSEDETAAKTVDFDLEDDNLTNEVTLSDIRKKNVKLLHSVDAKYRGKVTSRKDLEVENDGANGDTGDSENSSSAEESEDNDLVAGKSLSGRLRPQLDFVGVENGDSDEREASDEDDGDLESFSKQLKNISTKSAGSSDENEHGSDEEEGSSDQLGDEELDDEESGDEELDDEELDDEESGDEELADVDSEKEATDEDESDFDADISYADKSTEKSEKSPKQAIAGNILPKAQLQDQLKKGNSVQNQLQIWEKLLEVRIHSQKMLIKANSLPIYTKFQQISQQSPEFVELAGETQKNVEHLLSNMCEIQNILLKNYPETREFAQGKKRKSMNGAEADIEDSKRFKWSEELGNSFSKFTEYRNSVISKWYDRTRVLAPGKKSQQHTNYDVVRKIEGVLSNKVELVRKTQLHKGGYELFDAADGSRKVEATTTASEEAEIPDVVKSTADSSEQIYCTEIYDDSDFYHTQLRELIEYKTNSSSNASDMAKQFVELQKLRKKMKKTVDTRASKGRKIRYVVHNKLLNFMAPNDPGSWTNESKTELFRSLFGAGAQ